MNLSFRLSDHLLKNSLSGKPRANIPSVNSMFLTLCGVYSFSLVLPNSDLPREASLASEWYKGRKSEMVVCLCDKAISQFKKHTGGHLSQANRSKFGHAIFHKQLFIYVSISNHVTKYLDG
jgi:hypothetical protein